MFVAWWAAACVLKLVVAARLPLFVDEAFYWQEGRHLASAYSDLPGMTAWLVRLGTALGGENAFAVRLPFLVIGALVPWWVARIGRRWFGAIHGWRAGTLAVLLPLVGTLGVLALPDVLGVNGARRYVLLSQNTADVHATGGHWGSATMLTLAGGAVAKTEFRSFSDYLRDPALPSTPPPAPLAAYQNLTRWRIEDANWFPDFPTAVAALEQFPEMQGARPFAGAIARVLGDADLREQLGTGALARARELTWGATARGTLEVLAAEALRRRTE